MNIKSFRIIAMLFVMVVALGIVSATDDVSIDDGSEIDLETTIVADEDVSEDTTTSEYNVTNSTTDREVITEKVSEGGNTINFASGNYYDFSVKVGNYTTLNGNGAVIYGNGSTVFNIANTVGVTINGFTIVVDDDSNTSADGISGNFVYNAHIYDNTICNGSDGINIYRAWSNVTISGNTIYNMNRDGISLANPNATAGTNIDNWVGAEITDNVIYNTSFAIFIGGTYKGVISDNKIYNSTYAMQFAGKPNASSGVLKVNITSNNIHNVSVGIDMNHPDVVSLNLDLNIINATDYSINTNEYFNKDASKGSIIVTNNYLNGTVSDTFIDNIDKYENNYGPNAY